MKYELIQSLDCVSMTALACAALIIIQSTLFSPGGAALLQNMVLHTQTHMGQPALGGFMIKASLRNPSNNRFIRI